MTTLTTDRPRRSQRRTRLGGVAPAPQPAITYISPSAALGGAERMLLETMAATRREFPAAALSLIVTESGPLVSAARRLDVGVRVLRLPAEWAGLGEGGRVVASVADRVGPLGRIRSLWRYRDRLRLALRELAPDVVHSNGAKTHLLMGLVRPPVPVVCHLHEFPSRRPRSSRLLRWLLPRNARAIAVSEAVRRDARRVLPSLDVTTVHNVVDVEQFDPEGPRSSVWESADRRCLNVGLVATYANWKGHHVFLEAAARVLARRSTVGDRPARGTERETEETRRPVRFHVVGGPIYATAGSQVDRADLEATRRRLGLDRHVSFVPFRTDIAAVYRGLDVVVHASTAPEPFGLVVAEAMACGRSVVATGSGGIEEIVTDGHDGLVVPPADPDSLATALLRLIDDPTLRDRLGRRARDTIVNRFSHAELGPRLRDLYLSTIHRCPPSPVARYS